jgi:NADH pyrophosphatase NudC (nudix superfamily)
MITQDLHKMAKINSILEPKSSVDWRKNAAATDADADDEQLARTPQDVVAQLGFDPLEEAAIIAANGNDNANTMVGLSQSRATWTPQQLDDAGHDRYLAELKPLLQQAKLKKASQVAATSADEADEWMQGHGRYEGSCGHTIQTCRCSAEHGTAKVDKECFDCQRSK